MALWEEKGKAFFAGMAEVWDCCCPVGAADFLVLDESGNGLDPLGIVEIREFILRLNQEQQIHHPYFQPYFR